MNNIAISQPMYFPWIGLFEQILLSDIFVFYDDVQFSKGSFTNRVQIKTPQGSRWITVPIKKSKLNTKINEVYIDNKKNWKESHLSSLKSTYGNHKYFEDVLKIVSEVFIHDYKNISELSSNSVIEVLKYFNIKKDIFFSSSLDISSSNSDRVLKIVKYFDSKNYITGHGAKNYLNHELFEQNNINVMYMNYSHIKYPQKYGTFTPYVSILDLIANNGYKSIDYFKPKTIGWKNFLLGELK